MTVKVAVVHYSATGTTYRLARGVEEGAQSAGAEVRFRKVRELAPDEAIASNEGWSSHRLESRHVPEAILDDLKWADAIIFGSPTRYGLPAAQLKQFIDTTGPLWAKGELVNKIASSFSCSATAHGGQESTILALNNTFYHWGAIVLPLGYTVSEAFNGGGNPYGASYTSGTRVGEPDPETRAVAIAQGGRLARVARVIATAHARGLLDVRCSVVAEAE